MLNSPTIRVYRGIKIKSEINKTMKLAETNCGTNLY